MPIKIRLDPVLVLLLGLAALLLLPRLDNGVLWQDEAESAVLGRNTLRFGTPQADDGLNRVNPALAVTREGAWTYHPWATFYLTAGSFWLLGENTTAARLPSALLGLLSIGLAARLVKRLTADRSLARWTAFLLTVSIPFILHMRQCRYYGPSVFMSLWVVWAYVRLLQGRRWAGAELFGTLLLLFHVNHGVFVPLLLGLALHVLLTRQPPKVLRRLAWTAFVVFVCVLPFAFYLQAGQHHGSFVWEEISHHAQFYFRQINKYLLPVVFWAVVFFFWKPRRETLLGEPGSPTRQTWKLAACLLAAGLLFLIFGPKQRHFRYLIHLIPWILLIHAFLLRGWIRNHPKTGWLLAGAAIFLQPGSPVRSLQAEFLGELTHRYRGPMDGVVELLKNQAKPGQTVKIPYEEHTLLFYTPRLRIEPMFRTEDFARETFPDWIILRRDWLPAGFLESAYFRRIQTGYREILLDAPDIPWQNRPDPGYHRFRSDRSAPPVRVFQKN